jgi:hypothetical protein
MAVVRRAYWRALGPALVTHRDLMHDAFAVMANNQLHDIAVALLSRCFQRCLAPLRWRVCAITALHTTRGQCASPEWVAAYRSPAGARAQ